MTGEAAITKYIRQRIGLGDYNALTADKTRLMLLNWLRWVTDWTDPTPDEVVEWVAVPPAPNSKHRRESVLRKFYSWARKQRWIVEDIASMVPSIKAGKKHPKPIPNRDFLRAYNRADAQMRRALVLGRYGGMRASEIAAVHRDHLEGDQLYILGKGNKERWIPAHDQVRAAIIGAGGGFVFPGRYGGDHMTGPSMSRAVNRALPAPWTSHCLRHACGTAMYEDTGDLAVVAAFLGHESTRTTEMYVKVRDERVAAAVALLHLDLGGAA